MLGMRQVGGQLASSSRLLAAEVVDEGDSLPCAALGDKDTDISYIDVVDRFCPSCSSPIAEMDCDRNSPTVFLDCLGAVSAILVLALDSASVCPFHNFAVPPVDRGHVFCGVVRWLLAVDRRRS